MVDAIGWKTAGAVARAAPATTSMPVAAVATAAKDAPAAAVGATDLARTMAAEPPVDVDRVARIKAAIAAGKFPILPSTIADRLIALKLNWDPNEKA